MQSAYFQARDNLQKYGSLLLEELPNETTKILLDLCCKNNKDEVNSKRLLSIIMF
jgi:hypothetical protein